MKLKEQILNFLQDRRDWTHDRPLSEMALATGYKPATVGRECRLMVEQGLLERNDCDCVKPRHVVYRFKSREMQPQLDFNGRPVRNA